MLISTSGALINALRNLDDDFITVKIKETDREYVIESIGHEKNYTDSPLTHLCLICRDGGQGNIKR